jgi:hypothetical protein
VIRPPQEPLCATNDDERMSAMDLVPLVGVGAVTALSTGELARRAVLGSRMGCSFEALQVGTRQAAPRDDVVIRRAPVRGAVSIKAARHDGGPLVNDQESVAELIVARVGHIPRHARRAS